MNLSSRHCAACDDPPRGGRPHSEGEMEVVPDLVHGADVDGAHGAQQLGGQGQTRDTPLTRGAVRGRRRRAAQFGLGQQPQAGFRALAVHTLSIPRRR
jgi:hypothetical protein